MKNRNGNKTRLSIVLGVAWILSMGAGASFAGEVDGKGNVVPGGTNGKSDCSYSGQQDSIDSNDGLFKSIRTQNWGQIPKNIRDLIKSAGGNPGVACNPKKSGG